MNNWSSYLQAQRRTPSAVAGDFKNIAGIAGWRLKHFYDAVHHEPYKQALDFGCGTGLLRDYFRPGVYIGVDESQEAVDYARERWSADLFARIDPGYLLPFSSGSFDLVVTVGVLQHSPQDVKAAVFEEFGRIVDYRGRLILWEYTDITVPYRPSFTHQVPRLHPLSIGGYRELAKHFDLTYFDAELMILHRR